MKIKLVLFEDGIVNVGFRRISSLIKSKYPLTESYIYNVGGSSALIKNALFQSRRTKSQHNKDIFINPKFIEEINDADLIGFSGVSKFADYIKKTIFMIKSGNSKVLIIWGGVHATVFPEDAMKFADAVCIGEGEKSFLSLIDRIEKNKSIDDCEGFWVRKSDDIKKNILPPLMKSKELSLMPFQDYSFDIKHITHNNITLLTKDIYISQEGSKYTTVWSIGCPFHCTYCSNSKFIKNHKDYAKLRYPHPEFIINEITEVLKTHDYINYVEFEDDNFIMINLEDLKRFAYLYKEKIGLPFFVPGLHPSTISREKLDVLIDGGLKKVRMGIQSGSKKILSFYGRHTSREKILNASKILASYIPKINPPYYDLIIDNPVETEEDKLETLALLRKLERPYLLFVHSLRVIPGTELCEFSKNNQQFSFQPIEYTYQTLFDKKMRMMVYLTALFKIPDSIFDLFLEISKINYVNSLFFYIFKFLDGIKKFYYELKISNFVPLTYISPRLPLLLYNLHKRIKTVS
jgi:anaerobic magnesium-protoporphyrin IX monomethyl ester cyclase